MLKRSFISPSAHLKHKLRLLVGGLHIGGDGYPNAEQTLRILKNRLNIEITECDAWLPDSMHLWRLSRANWYVRLLKLFRLLFGNLISVITTVWKQGHHRTPVYVPYPAVFFLWWLSWVPSYWRPRCIADAYISIWDTMYRDRTENESISWSEKVLKAFESRALRAAKIILVDTLANKQMLITEFGVNAKTIIALPLAINEHIFLECQTKKRQQPKTFTVLFVGTFIPLHGIENILEAIEILMKDHRFNFHLLGDGQLGHLVEQYSASFDKKRFTWSREWSDLSSISDAICASDICLGVFGGEGKAARVLPFKVYMYLASGKAIISQYLFSLPEATPSPPILTTKDCTLADAIIELADNSDLRQKIAAEAREYYLKYLSNERLATEWFKLLTSFNMYELMNRDSQESG